MPPGQGLRRGFADRSGNRFAVSRKVNREIAASSHLAEDVDEAAVSLDNGLRSGKPQPSTFANVFRREKRIENPRQQLRRDACSGVRHSESDIISRAGVPVKISVSLIQSAVF